MHPSVHVAFSEPLALLGLGVRHRARDLLDGDADEVGLGDAADVVVVLLERDEEHVDVEGRQVGALDVELCDGVCEALLLLIAEGAGVAEDAPERHDG